MTKNNRKILCALILCAPAAVCAMDVQNSTNSGPKLSYAVAQARGTRPTQEDTWAVGDDLFAVFDGHGGDHVSKYAAENTVRLFKQARAEGSDVPQAIKSALATIEQEVVKKYSSGSTAVLGACDDQGQIHFVWLGDSLAATWDKTDQGYKLCWQTEPHTPLRQDEAAFVLKRDCELCFCPKSNPYAMRAVERWEELPVADIVSGDYALFARKKGGKSMGLMMTRALGDPTEKDFIRVEPECSPAQKLTENSLIMLASDGVTDAFRFDDITRQLNKLMAFSDAERASRYSYIDKSVIKMPGTNNERLSQVAQLLVHRVLEKREGTHTDNTTVVLIQLNQEAK